MKARVVATKFDLNELGHHMFLLMFDLLTIQLVSF